MQDPLDSLLNFPALAEVSRIQEESIFEGRTRSVVMCTDARKQKSVTFLYQ